ncbi:MAG TPA: hypothetical protein VLT87_05910, partial [Thermoanaerobaculia bacterium]|nr:hypothetical protein [Thermoanaerobaculia bacterium]
MKTRSLLIPFALAATLAAAYNVTAAPSAVSAERKGAKPVEAAEKVGKIEKSDAEWKKILTPEQYRVL